VGRLHVSAALQPAFEPRTFQLIASSLYSKRGNDKKEKIIGRNTGRVKRKSVWSKVKQSHYRPGQTLRVSRRLRLPDFKTVGT
jgi:hypothetical protein